MIKFHCYVCNGEGLEDKECPKCGKTKKIVIDYQNDKYITKVQDTNIPLQYIGKLWSKKTLISTHSQFAQDKSFLAFCENLERMHDKFVLGQLPMKSGIIIAPKKYSKVTFAYSCMQYAVQSGYTVAPLLDTIQVKRLKGLMGDRNYKLFNKFDADSYFSADICFITVTKLINRREAYEIILEVMDTRSRLGLPTVVISEFSIDEMSDWDRNKVFNKIYDYDDIENPLRYPAIVQFSEKFL